jgi:hypothetical protein
VETSTASTSKTYPKQTEVVAYPYITSTASSNSKPHSFPGIEADTPIPRPPFAQKRSRTGCLVPCAALFTHSCQNHFLTPLPACGGFNLAPVLSTVEGLVAVNPYNQTYHNNRQTSCWQ